MSPLRSAPPADLSLPSSFPIGQLCVAPWSGSAPLALEPGVARRLFLSALLSSPHSALLCSGPPQPAWPLTGQPGSCSPLGLGSATPSSLLIGCFSPWGCAACLPPFLLPLFLLSHSFLPTACRSGHLLSSCSCSCISKMPREKLCSKCGQKHNPPTGKKVHTSQYYR